MTEQNEPQPVETMLVQDKRGLWHIAIDGGYDLDHAKVQLEGFLTLIVRPVQTIEPTYRVSDGR